MLILKVKKNNLWLMLSAIFLISLTVFSNAYAVDYPECKGLHPDCNYLMMMKDFNAEATAQLNQINADVAAGKTIDWVAVANDLEMVYTNPDDVLTRLNEIHTITNEFAQFPDPSTMDVPQQLWLLPPMGELAKKLLPRIKLIQGDATPPPPPVFGDDKNEDTSLPAYVNAQPDTENTGSFFDVSYMLSQIEKQIPALIRLVMAIGYLAGFIMIVLAILKLKAYGQQTVMSSQHAQLGPSLSYFIFGTILMFLPSMVQIATNSVMPEAGDVAYEYSASSSDIGYAQLFSAIIAIIRLVGYIAFLRGWLILSKTGGHGAQPGNLGKGIIHLIGGILAINIITTWEIVRASFGFVW